MCTESIQFSAYAAISISLHFNPLHMNSVLNEFSTLIILFNQFQMVTLPNTTRLTFFTTNNYTIEKHGIIFAQ